MIYAVSVHFANGRFPVLGWGTCDVSPDSLVCHQIQTLADVISEVPKCSKIQVIRDSAPDPAGGAYSALPDTFAEGEGLAAPLKNPIPPSGLRASFLRVSGSNSLQRWQPY